MKKYIGPILLLTIVASACSEQPEADHKSEIEQLIDGFDKDNVQQSDLDELMEAMSEEDGSYTLNAPKENFKIEFPVTNVKESTTTQLINNEEVEIFHYTANMQGKDDENIAYQLDYVLLPEIDTEEEIEDQLNEQRDYLISAANATLEFEKIIENNGAPGRHLFLTIDDSEIKTNYKMFFKNGIFYKLAVVTKEGNLFNKKISRFFDSFEITE